MLTRLFRRFSSGQAHHHDLMKIGKREFETDSMTNVRPAIVSKLELDLLQQPGHPLNRIKKRIYEYFDGFHCQDMSDPIVTVKQNFDDLGFPHDHVGRTLGDSYYINREWMLRTHMTAHEKEMIQAGHTSFLMAGSVFRRDEIDSTHYPVFHQLEGVHMLNDERSIMPDSAILHELLAEKQDCHDAEQVKYGMNHLQGTLDGLLRHLFGAKTPIRWQPCYFPFTQPSMEAEIEFGGRWVEVLGCGLLQTFFLEASKAPTNLAWAFGLGLERLAMILYGIPDIRLFWSRDVRFLEQFDASIPDEKLCFKPFSKYPYIGRDLSFWLPKGEDRGENDLFDLVRSVAGDLVESVKLIDSFAKDGRKSQCFRIIYRSMDRSLTDEEVNEMQAKIRSAAEHELRVTLR